MKMQRRFMPQLSEGFHGERTVRISDSEISSFLPLSIFKNLYITSIGCYPNARLHYYNRSQEQANIFILLYCIDGSGFCVVDGHQYNINKNELIIIPSGVAHSYGSNINDPWTIYWCHFNGTDAALLSQCAYKPLLIAPNNNSRIQERISIFEEIITMLHIDTSVESYEYANSCFIHLLCSIKYIDKYQKIKESRVSYKKISQRAIHFMKECIDKNITVEDIASYCGYSKGRFITIFKSEVGESPIHHLNRLRIDLACQYLRQTNIKSYQLCHKVGINNPLYFSRLFKKYMHISPLKYKQQMCRNLNE